MMNSLTKSELIARASLLIKYGFRTTIIALDTGLPSHIIRKLYKEITGFSPGPGQLPEADAIVKSRRALVEGSLLMALYVNIGGESVYRNLNINALMKAYDAYLVTRTEANLPNESPWKKLTINEGWVLARDLRSKLASLHKCRCGSQYLTVSQQRIQLKCPVCEIMAEQSNRELLQN